MRRTPVKHLLRNEFAKASNFETKILLCAYWTFNREERNKEYIFSDIRVHPTKETI